MVKIMVKFVNGCAEVLQELEVDRPDDPPMSVCLGPPTPAAVASAESEAHEAWEAVYVREQDTGIQPPWVYRFCGLADPEE
ncbi:hypothetical protein [Catellatospora sichuanensis]|uniref:hypothetical protein n=1 Tax=Catellatospora sichuanensis TaxID=1969805 RepID=UPI001181C83B|nr:hypothetical protein [Catellatospora sichuanensis]